MAILARGFAVVRKPGNIRAIRNASDLAADDPVSITFAAGNAAARIVEVTA